MRLRRTTAAITAAGLLLAGLAACGDDDSDTKDQAGSTDTGDYCDAEVRLDQAFQAIDADAEDPDAFPAALATASDRLDEVVAAAPDELGDELATVQEAFGQVVATKEVDGFFTEEVGAATGAVHDYDLAHCDWSAVAVTAEEYHFTADLPTEPGAVSFELTNQGVEPHELIVARKKDAVAGSAVDALNALEGEESFPDSFDQVASVFAAPGDSGHALANLEAGQYVAFCPIPVGSAPDAPGDGPPHFTQGMVTGFEVS